MPKGQNAPFVNFGKFNHSNAAPDATHDAFVGDLKRKFWRAVWRLTKFLVRKWYWTFPASILWNLLRTPGDFGVWFMFFLVTTGCMYYRFKVKKPKVVVVPTEDEQAIQRYSKEWAYVARKAGLAQAPTAEGMGAYKAYVQLATTNNAAKQFKEAAYGAEDNSVVPELLGIETAPLGYTHRLALLPGTTVETLASAAGKLAVLWKVESVRVAPGVPGQVLVTPIEKDPLADVEPVTIENYKSFGASVKGVNAGLTEDNQPWIFPLDQFSGVIAGTPGSGKSVGLNVLLSQMAYCPDIQICGIDAAGGVELGDWSPRFSALAIDQDEAIEMLESLWEIHQSRIKFLKENHKKSISNYGYSEDLPLIVVAIDEAAQLFLLESTDREQKAKGQKLVNLVQNIVTVSRKTGICVLLATQKPGSTTIPTGIRDNMGVKVSYRVTTGATAAMVLGDVDMSAIAPTNIKLHDKGRAVVADQDSVLQYVHSRLITEETGMAIVEENKHLRKSLSALLLTPQVPEEDNYVYEGTIDEY